MGGCLGGVLFGVIVPLLLATFCILKYDDIGGLLFFPILACLGGVLGTIAGAIVGAVVGAIRRRRK